MNNCLRFSVLLSLVTLSWAVAGGKCSTDRPSPSGSGASGKSIPECGDHECDDPAIKIFFLNLIHFFINVANKLSQSQSGVVATCGDYLSNSLFKPTSASSPNLFAPTGLKEQERHLYRFQEKMGPLFSPRRFQKMSSCKVSFFGSGSIYF